MDLFSVVSNLPGSGVCDLSTTYGSTMNSSSSASSSTSSSSSSSGSNQVVRDILAGMALNNYLSQQADQNK